MSIIIISLFVIAWIAYGFIMSIKYFETFVFGGLNTLGWIMFGPGFMLMKAFIRIFGNSASNKLFNVIGKLVGGLKW